ncbi:hypothetical protein TVAG_354590 [Trichomonas vaginalis G3]|uniref:Uncharacterized protein n=1 Tax=Trichomonas vaginalis (strain ATCC PRA-98 / G3) TaxID=412133 RepID=A2FMZ1_TRIV3|nr:aggrephagy protein [Trichomonas vaginalis G3]EAX93720.1 hypothetical protein TVAG_354590 [Trichomonas vaginalis G3]KAI5498729.1 aggrephagy protein [Trichomonas vaginalis G3]|eukprot:XP_001306650.1 hypothetical protein [Trichomonas vaginalis G3]
MKGKDKAKNMLIEILNTFSGSISLDQNDKEFSEYYQSWNMPLLKRSELTIIIENVKKFGKKTELKALLSSYFTFEPEILKIFVEKYSTDIKGLNKCSYIVIANALGYISHNIDIQYLDLVLNSLYFFFNHMTLSPKMQYLYFLIVDYVTSKQNILIPQSALSQIIEAITLHIDSSKMVFNSACNLLEVLYILNDCLNAVIILKIINNCIRISLENNTYHENDVLIRTISFRLQYFESPVLECVQLLGQTKVNDAKKGLFAMLGNYFYSLSNKFSSNIIYPIEKDSKYAYYSENPKYDNIEFHHSVVTGSMFNVSIPGVNSSLSEEDLIDNQFFDTIKIIGKILQKCGAAFTASFFISTSNFITDENCNLMVYLAYLYLLKRTTHTKNIPEKVFYTVMNKVIFNPYITMFDKIENFEHLAFIRQTAIETIFLKMPQYLPRSLVILRDFPYLFAEVCLRIQTLQLQGVTFEDDSFQALSAVEQKLRSIYSLDPDNAEKTIQARDSLFVFIFEILNNPQVTTTCFSSPSFASAFLTAFFEESFSDIIFGKLTQVFRTVNSAISQTVGFVTGA